MTEMTGGSDRDAVPPDVDLERVWTGVAAEVWRREPGWLEGLASRLLGAPGLARALVSTPSLLLPWVIASIVVLGAGAVTTIGTGTPLVALIAPAVAAAGIAYAYGPGIDPAWELSMSMAVSDRMVLLARALSVFAVYALLGLAATAASGAAASITFGWLVPMTAVSALALAAATLTRSPNAGVGIGVGAWCITVLASQGATGDVSVAVSDQSLFAYYAVCAVICGAIVVFTTRNPEGVR